MLQAIAKHIASVHAKIVKTLDTAPERPDGQQFLEIRGFLEERASDYFALQGSLQESRVGDVLLPYYEALQEGDPVSKDMRLAIIAYRRANRSMMREALPAASEWVTKHGERLGRRDEVEAFLHVIDGDKKAG